MRRWLILPISVFCIGLIGFGCTGQQPLAPLAGKDLNSGLAKFSTNPGLPASVTARVTLGGEPASGLEVGFSRSISGRSADYNLKGTTDSDGTVTLAIEATGYYVARATDTSTNTVLSKWASIPVKAGNEVILNLPIGGRAKLVSNQRINSTLTLNFVGIQPLVNGFHYEGWAIIDGPVPTGKFNVNSDGDLVDIRGALIPGGKFRTRKDLSLATAIVITIEPDGDKDAIPADTHYLAGGVESLSSDLTVGHPAALGDDFSQASGTYILATPTDDPSGNENSGIWFLDLSGGSPAQGLQLPTLPLGWRYEGWGVIGGVPVTTGTFTNPASADDAAPYSGTGGGPPFPGEDFLNNAPSGLTFPTDLSGATGVISIEPFPDDGPGPFTLKPLVGDVPSAATDHVTYDLGNNAGGFPTGTATIR